MQRATVLTALRAVRHCARVSLIFSFRLVLLLVVPFSEDQDAGPACFDAHAHSWFNCGHVGSTERSVCPCQSPCAWLTPFTKLVSRPNAARTAPTLDTRATWTYASTGTARNHQPGSSRGQGNPPSAYWKRGCKRRKMLQRAKRCTLRGSWLLHNSSHAAGRG